VIKGLLLFFGGSAVLLLCGIAAPYGRYAEHASWLFGREVDGRLAWIVQEVPNLANVLLCWKNREPGVAGGFPNKLLLGLFTCHYINRTLIFPLRIRGGKPTLLLPFIMATAFCTINGYLQARTLTHLHAYPEGYALSPQFVVGVAVFLTGVRINTQADGILLNLRKPGEKVRALE
jgi:3-oxo-5-alpha-steroid 4-dehydrogenase 1